MTSCAKVKKLLSGYSRREINAAMRRCGRAPFALSSARELTIFPMKQLLLAGKKSAAGGYLVSG